MLFSKRLKEVKPSATLAITSKAKSMLAGGEDVIVLAAGEPDFDTPELVKEAAVNAIKSGFTKYTPAGGTKALKEAICRKLSSENRLEYSTEEVVVSCGAKHSLYNIFQVLCDPGDEVLIIHPYWVSYPEMVRLAGGKPIFVKTESENGFKVRVEDIRSKLTDKTRAIVVNSPSNPSGVLYEEGELREIAGLCLDKEVTVVSDEIYEKIIFDGKEHVSPASFSEGAFRNTIVVNGVSKSFSMTGWRIGYLAGNKDLIRKIITLQSHSTSNPCSISQVAAECALSEDLGEEIERNRLEFQRRRDVLMDLLSGEERISPFKPGGAFYMFCDVSRCGIDSLTFSQRLLEEKKVAVIPGSPFGDDRYVRISFATDMKTIEEGVARIKEWISEL
ncbi:MAG: pyridoxal phosphate-dependent aminotransferase [Candidatus Omnitrophota bacterium]|nr:pyridoxal phosphate-dependent aminotransferase [Candidatus Omnitrophota bacterium]